MEKKRIIIVSIFIIVFIIAIILSMINYKGKYSVKFETGTNDIFLTKYVEKNKTIKKPTNPRKEGYIFKEWQLNGKKYDFNDSINKDIVLTAKWVKEEYIKVLFKNDDKEIDSLKLLKGESIKGLPKINKDNYEFLGWYLENEKYDNQALYDDTILVAKFIPSIKIGDTVKIIGSYSNASDKEDYLSSVAIGWEREVIDIIEGKEYPYVIGDSRGVTGYFKIESIEKKS